MKKIVDMKEYQKQYQKMYREKNRELFRKRYFDERYVYGDPCVECSTTLKHIRSNLCVFCEKERRKPKAKSDTKHRASQKVKKAPEPKPLTARQIAKEAGLTRYEGLPCKNCGRTTRRVSSKDCVFCRNESQKRRNSEARALSQKTPKPARPLTPKSAASKVKARNRKHSRRFQVELLIKQRCRCACCRQYLDINFHIDHIVPLSAGGSSEQSNLQLLCPICNLRKGAETSEEFYRCSGYLL